MFLPYWKHMAKKMAFYLRYYCFEVLSAKHHEHNQIKMSLLWLKLCLTHNINFVTSLCIPYWNHFNFKNWKTKRSYQKDRYFTTYTYIQQNHNAKFDLLLRIIKQCHASVHHSTVQTFSQTSACGFLLDIHTDLEIKLHSYIFMWTCAKPSVHTEEPWSNCTLKSRCELLRTVRYIPVELYSKWVNGDISQEAESS